MCISSVVVVYAVSKLCYVFQGQKVVISSSIICRRKSETLNCCRCLHLLAMFSQRKSSLISKRTSASVLVRERLMFRCIINEYTTLLGSLVHNCSSVLVFRTQASLATTIPYQQLQQYSQWMVSRFLRSGSKFNSSDRRTANRFRENTRMRCVLFVTCCSGHHTHTHICCCFSFVVVWVAHNSSCGCSFLFHRRPTNNIHVLACADQNCPHFIYLFCSVPLCLLRRLLELDCCYFGVTALFLDCCWASGCVWECVSFCTFVSTNQYAVFSWALFIRWLLF